MIKGLEEIVKIHDIQLISSFLYSSMKAHFLGSSAVSLKNEEIWHEGTLLGRVYYPLNSSAIFNL